MDTNTAHSEQKFAITPEEFDLLGRKTDILSVTTFSRKQKTTSYDTSLTILPWENDFSRKQISIKTHWSEMGKLRHRVSMRCTKSTM